MEEYIIAPVKPRYKKWYRDDMYMQRKKNEPLNRFEKINFFHPNINSTIKK